VITEPSTDTTTELIVNGERQVVRGNPLTPLVTVLREHLELTGAKAACGEGFCGSCTVLLEGRPIVSCLVPVGQVAGRPVRTVESLDSADGALSALQRALQDGDAVQCGMCFPGLLMTLTALLERGAVDDEADLRHGLVGNVCRCTGYQQIIDCVLPVLRGAPAGEPA
jgi:aerobic carbon-monoxide dehydrogenase small subunit